MNTVAKVEPQGTVTVGADAALDMILRAASDPKTDVAKMEGLTSLYERMKSHQAEAEFNEAMSRAQAEVDRVVVDSANSQTRSKYASYSALDLAIRPVYLKHGFSLSFDTREAANQSDIRVLCYVSRGSCTRTYQCDMPADGKGARGNDVMTRTHATGSAMTYGRRYLLAMIFNVVVGQDDDGNAAGGRPQRVAQPQRPARINPEQSRNLLNLIGETGSDTGKLLAFFKVQAISDLTAAQYADAVGILQNKKARQ